MGEREVEGRAVTKAQDEEEAAPGGVRDPEVRSEKDQPPPTPEVIP